MKIKTVKLSNHVLGHVLHTGVTHVLVSSQYLDECVSLINHNPNYGATVGHYHGYQNMDNVNFLIECPNLTHVNLEDPFNDLFALGRLQALNTLRLHPKSTWHDFSVFSELSVLTAGCHSLVGLEHCTKLHSLKLRQVTTASGDLTNLCSNSHLENLSLVNGEVTNLKGIDAFPQLRRVELAYLKNLRDLSGLLSLRKLQTLELYSNPNAVDLKVIRQLLNLRVLKIFEGEDIASLNFILDLPALEELSFVSTNIVDGDLSPLLKHPTLRDVNFLDKSHYSHTQSQIRSRLGLKM